MTPGQIALEPERAAVESGFSVDFSVELLALIALAVGLAFCGYALEPCRHAGSSRPGTGIKAPRLKNLPQWAAFVPSPRVRGEGQDEGEAASIPSPLPLPASGERVMHSRP
jgi:hypothetical protein